MASNHMLEFNPDCRCSSVSQRRLRRLPTVQHAGCFLFSYENESSFGRYPPCGSSSTINSERWKMLVIASMHKSSFCWCKNAIQQNGYRLVLSPPIIPCAKAWNRRDWRCTVRCPIENKSCGDSVRKRKRNVVEATITRL